MLLERLNAAGANPTLVREAAKQFRTTEGQNLLKQLKEADLREIEDDIRTEIATSGSGGSSDDILSKLLELKSESEPLPKVKLINEGNSNCCCCGCLKKICSIFAECFKALSGAFCWILNCGCCPTKMQEEQEERMANFRRAHELHRAMHDQAHQTAMDMSRHAAEHAHQTHMNMAQQSVFNSQQF